MKVVGGIFWALLLAASIAHAQDPRFNPAAGDEDPFPLMCADFSGAWKSDAGDHYAIQQKQCSFLKVQMSYGSQQDVMTIIPDNKVRADRGSQVRHRWNSPTNATVLESHRTYMDGPGTRVTEVTMFERASGDLLLQTTYTTVEYLNAPGQPPHHEYNQTVFRRLGGATTDPDSDLSIPNGRAHPGKHVHLVPRRE